MSEKETLPFLQHPDSNDYHIELDRFSVVSRWYHYAILELMEIRGFQESTKWIAQTLRLSTSKVKIAIERLQRVGLIEIDERGNWHDLTNGTSTNITPDGTSMAQKLLQKEILNKGIDAIEEVSFEKRSNTSMTFAIDPDKLPQARAEIKKFRRKMAQLLTDSSNKTEVYNLAVALYPLTNNSENLEKDLL